MSFGLHSAAWDVRAGQRLASTSVGCGRISQQVDWLDKSSLGDDR